MKKKKKTTYLLLAVIAIYGAIAVRFIFLSGEGDSAQGVQPSHLEQFIPEAVTAQKSFVITNDYRDPFLGTLPKRQRPASLSKRSISTSRKPKETMTWPSLKYKGLVADPKQGKKVFAIELQGKEYIMRQGQTIDGVTVHKGTTSEITLIFKKKKKTISLGETPSPQTAQ